MARNDKTNEYIKSFAGQGLTVGQIKAELKAKRMKAPDSRIAYYVQLARKGNKGSSHEEMATKPAKGSSFQRALKVLETDVLTDSEKVAIAANILKAKPSA